MERGHADALADLVSQEQTHYPLIPRRLAGIRTGPELDLSFEDTQSPPIDGSNSLLRLYSPFVIRIEPPLILDPFLQTGGSGGAKGMDPGMYANAGQRGSFARARDALKASKIGQTDFGSATPEEYIARGSGAIVVGATQTNAGAKSDRGPGGLGIPSIADLRVAVDIASQLSAIANIPPLVLLINPASLAINHTKVQQFTSRTRFGYVLHSWGDDQPKMTITAKCGAFISEGRGVQMASMRDSAAWQNLMALFQMYKNGGYIHDTVGKSHAHHMVGCLSISYDQCIYRGHIESMNWTHDETNQKGGVEFQMEFVASSRSDTSSRKVSVAPLSNPARGGRSITNDFERLQDQVKGDFSNTPTEGQPFTPLPNGKVQSGGFSLGGSLAPKSAKQVSNGKAKPFGLGR